MFGKDIERFNLRLFVHSLHKFRVLFWVDNLIEFLILWEMDDLSMISCLITFQQEHTLLSFGSSPQV